MGLGSKSWNRVPSPGFGLGSGARKVGFSLGFWDVDWNICWFGVRNTIRFWGWVIYHRFRARFVWFWFRCWDICGFWAGGVGLRSRC